MKSLNLNYDDFYKFLTSLTILLSLLLIYAIYRMVQLAYSLGVSDIQIDLLIISFYVFLGLLGLSILAFGWAMWKWKKNQDKLDKKLSAELGLKIAQIEKTEAESTRSMLGYEKLF